MGAVGRAEPAEDPFGLGAADRVKDAATVLAAVAGYDARDAATAASVGQIPDRAYPAFADDASLKGVRIGVVREFMQPFTKADEDSIRIADQAIADLAKAGATIVDPGTGGALFRNAIARMLPAYDAPMLAAAFKELFPAGTAIVASIGTYGDVIHTFVERRAYAGAFLPGYVAHSLAIRPAADVGTERPSGKSLSQSP